MNDLSLKINSAQEVGGVSATTSSFRFHSIAQALGFHAAERPDATYLVFCDGEERREYTYRTFRSIVARTAALLHRSGVKQGSNVISAAHNHDETVVLMFATWWLGACLVPLNMTEDDDRLVFIIGDCDATVAVVRPEYMDRVSPMCAAASVPVLEVGSRQWDSAASMNEFVADSSSMLDEECLIVYTSGTTGKPKGVVLVQRNLMADGEGISAWHAITGSERMMCVLPIHHVNGTIVTLVTPLLAGASVVLLRKFKTDAFFTTIRRESVTITSVVPTLLAFLLEADSDDCDVRRHGFRHIICGAGPLTCELAGRFEHRYGIPIMHGYGLSETTCYSCFLETHLAESDHRHWMQDFGFPSIGTPIPQNEMRIHDASGAALDAGVRGEIVIRGWNVMKEYYKNNEANAQAFEHGWFRSGDEGFWSPDPTGKPYFFITGRIKELIIRGGVNIAPLEIDEIINRAPGVRAGISVGFENDFYGEEVGALVIADDGADAKTIIDFCGRHLPFSKTPKVVLFSNELPVTSTGKYQRNKVKHLFADWKASQFKQSRH